MAWCCIRIQERKGKGKASNKNPDATFPCLTLFPTSLISRSASSVTDTEYCLREVSLTNSLNMIVSFSNLS